MKLTEQQALTLVLLLQSSLEKNVVGYLNISFTDRARLLNVIISQQDSDVFVDLKER